MGCVCVCGRFGNAVLHFWGRQADVCLAERVSQVVVVVVICVLQARLDASALHVIGSHTPERV